MTPFPLLFHKFLIFLIKNSKIFYIKSLISSFGRTLQSSSSVNLPDGYFHPRGVGGRRMSSCLLEQVFLLFIIFFLLCFFGQNMPQRCLVQEVVSVKVLKRRDSSQIQAVGHVLPLEYKTSRIHFFFWVLCASVRPFFTVNIVGCEPQAASKNSNI